MKRPAFLPLSAVLLASMGFKDATMPEATLISLSVLQSDRGAKAYDITDLGTLGGDFGVAYAINARDQVIGESRTLSGVWHAFLWEAGVMTDLGTLGGEHSFATDINARGQVVAQSDTPIRDTRRPLGEGDGNRPGDLGQQHQRGLWGQRPRPGGRVERQWRLGNPRLPVGGRDDDRPRHSGWRLQLGPRYQRPRPCRRVERHRHRSKPTRHTLDANELTLTERLGTGGGVRTPHQRSPAPWIGSFLLGSSLPTIGKTQYVERRHAKHDDA